MLDQPAQSDFAFVRLHRVMTMGYLEKQEAHAKRLVPTAEPRQPPVPAGCIFWSAFNSPNGDLISDYRSMRSKLGARERRGAALCIHMLIGVSPRWVAQMGDIHDPANPRVRDLFRAALDFSTKHFNGVFAARMDLDERGGAVVDVYTTHAHERAARLKKNGTRGTPVREISVKSALDAMSSLAGAQKSFVALQTVWAKFARERLHADIVRGVAKEVSGRRHLSVQEFRQQIARKRELDAQHRGSLATMVTCAAVWLDAEQEQRRRTAAQDQRDRIQDDREAVQDALEDGLHKRQLALGVREAEADAHAQAYTEWASAKVAFEADLDVRRSQTATAQAEAQAHIDDERRALEASRQEMSNVAATREAELHLRERVLIEREARNSRQGVWLDARASDLTDAQQAAETAAEAAAWRTELAAETEAQAIKVQQQIRAGLSMIADARLFREDLDHSLQAAAVRPFLVNVFDAIDARTALERQALHEQRQRQADKDRALEHRALLVSQREQEADERHATTDAREARATAHQRGLAMVASGLVRTVADIEADAELAPARDLIGEALASTHAARAALDRREQQVAAAEAEVATKQAHLRIISAAREAGLRAVESGAVWSAEQITARTDLAPATQDLVRTLAVINATVKRLGQRAATQIAQAGEARARLEEEREEVRTAQARAAQASKEARDRIAAADRAKAVAVERSAAAMAALQHVRRLLSSVAAFVDAVAARTDLPASVVPAVLKVIDAHRELGEVGRGRGTASK